MPRVSLPAAPASERKHGVWQTNFSGRSLGGDDLLAHEVGHRHLGGRNQIEARCSPRMREQILLELRQLPGADQRVRVHQVRRIDLGVAVLAGVQVEHELRERAMQVRDLCRACTTKRAPEMRPAASKSSPPQVLAELDVIARLEAERARLAPAAHLDVRTLVAAVRHRFVQQVRQSELPALELPPAPP